MAYSKLLLKSKGINHFTKKKELMHSIWHVLNIQSPQFPKVTKKINNWFDLYQYG